MRALPLFMLIASATKLVCALKCYQCDTTEECKDAKATECSASIFKILKPACGSKSSGTGIRRYCVAHGDKGEYGCVKASGADICVCAADGCNSPTTAASSDQGSSTHHVVRPDLNDNSHNHKPAHPTTSRPTHRTTTTTRPSEKPKVQIEVLPKIVTCYECKGCATPNNPQKCPTKSTQCVKITTGDLVTRTCSSVKMENKCTKTPNNLGTETEMCSCEGDYCNSSTLIRASTLITSVFVIVTVVILT